MRWVGLVCFVLTLHFNIMRICELGLSNIGLGGTVESRGVFYSMVE